MTGEAGESAQQVPEQYGLCYVDLSRTDFAPGAASLLPEETARRERAVPVERRGNVTVVAVSSPADELSMEALRAATGGDVMAVIAPSGQVASAISRLYGDIPPGRAGRRGAEGEPISGPSTLEESLRDVLAAPELLPPPVPPLGQSDEPALDADAALDPALDSEAEAPGSGDEGGNGSRPKGDGPKHTPRKPPPVRPPGTRLGSVTGQGAHAAVPTASNGSGSHVALAPPAPPTSPDLEGEAMAVTLIDGAVVSPTAPADAGPNPPAPPDAAAPADGDAPEAASALDDSSTPDDSAPSHASATAGLLVTGEAASLEDVLAPADLLSPGEVQTLSPSVTVNGDGGAHAAPEAPLVLERAVRDDAGSPAAASSPDGALAPPGGASPPLPPPGKGSPGGEAGDVENAQWPALARVLVASGRVSFDDMVRALRDHRALGESLARYLQREELVTEEDLVRAMAHEMGLEFVDLTVVPVDPTVSALVPDAVARRHMVLPIAVEDGVPIVAMANPTDVFAIDDLRTIMGRNFTTVVALRSQIENHLRRMNESESDVAEAAQSAEGTVGDAAGYEIESLHSVVEDAPIVRYVNLLILQALNERASDIHIEPTPRKMRIRFRIDGVMHDASSASPAIHAAVISRLKVLGEMDITEHRVPQEGRVSVSVGDRQIDLRLAIIPSLYGETCVMRLLDKSASIRHLTDLGLLNDTQERYAVSYKQPYGVILVTGPTGAGKTTTLYATLQEVMSKERSVVTVEDPVEYQIEGITQVQINPKVGLQFSTALRSILRADPDIILVGEIRDIETASIAMEAALSGHLVLTTLHTNTAASTPLRLTEMGIEPFLVTSAVSGVLTQRLARVLCERCKSPYEASIADFRAAGYKDSDLDGLDSSTLWHANGCRTCSHTGYYGRMILCEVMPMTEEIERMIIEQESIVAMERMAVEQGMRTLRQDGLMKALGGHTTLEEVLRVVV